jgi:photosystem II stability/assembly factor-like uncharacterized protein
MCKKITYFILLFLVTNIANAQFWESCTNGIEDESIVTLAVDGQRIYAGTANGRIYITDNNGASWIKAMRFESKPLTFAFYKGNILAGTYNQGILQSLNGGFVWTQLNKDTLEKGIRNIEVVGDNIFILTDSPDKAGYNGRISRSTDGGITWTPVLTGKSYNNLLSLTSINSTIFVSTSLGDVYRTDNFGDTWTNVGKDLPDKNIFQLKAQGENLLAGSEETRFFISSDLGLTWTNANKGFPDDNVSSIYVNGTNIFVGTEVSGVYLSTDSGGSWNDFSDTLWNRHVATSCLVSNSRYLFCSTGGYYGIYRKDITKLISPVADESKDGFEIYPNPAEDYITISLGTINPTVKRGVDIPSAIYIYNTIGELVLSVGTGRDLSAKINISDLPIGLYFVRNGNKVIKFTKN